MHLVHWCTNCFSKICYTYHHGSKCHSIRILTAWPPLAQPFCNPKKKTVNLKLRENHNSQMIRKPKIYCLWRKTNRNKIRFQSFTVFSLPRELFYNQYFTRLKYQIINSRTLSRRVSDVSAMFALFWSLVIVIFCATLDIFFSCQ